MIIAGGWGVWPSRLVKGGVFGVRKKLFLGYEKSGFGVRKKWFWGTKKVVLGYEKSGFGVQKVVLGFKKWFWEVLEGFLDGSKMFEA